MKKMKIFLLGLSLLIVVGIILIILALPKVHITTKEAFLTYKDKGQNIYTSLSEEESSTLFEIFNNRKLYRENLSCGFSTDVSITFGNDIFCIAYGDSCPTVKLKNKYFNISKEERIIICKIFEKYGGIIPCD